MESIFTKEQLKNIENGRLLLDSYRKKHDELYLDHNDKDIPDKHIPLQNELEQGLKDLGFQSIQDFHTCNEVLTLQENGDTLKGIEVLQEYESFKNTVE